MSFHFDNSFARELEGLYQPQQPEVPAGGKLVFANHSLAQSLRLDWDLDRQTQLWSDWLSGARLPEGAQPIAQAYAGHQFGQFSPSLGDGRAVLLGEVLDRDGNRFDIALKGSGRTLFSRNGDGKAALGPMLREALISEAMHALGVPTTRTLAVVRTPETILRQQQHPCAVLTRIASSHIRIGTFQFFGARRAQDKVARLIDYTLARHHPQQQHHNKALAVLELAVDQLARLVADWMSIGFIHGVMNTDNMSMAGETLDYGPCAFIDSYHPATVFSSIDHQGRYAYKNQPAIAQWNLARLAEALLHHIDSDKDRAIELATESIDSFVAAYKQHWQSRMLAKLGLARADDTSDQLLNDWLDLLENQQIDFTGAFIALADTADGDTDRLFSLASDIESFEHWLQRWQTVRKSDLGCLDRENMLRVNPTLIPRNHLVEQVLEAAEAGSMEPFDDLFSALQNPFDSSQRDSRFAQPADPEFTRNFRTYCGT